MSKVRITKPDASTKQAVSFPAGEGGKSVELGFDTGEATVERIDNDLVFIFDGGAETRLTDFFVTGGEALPTFVLADGTEVLGADVLRQLNSDMDLETAAGPGSQSASGGSGEYADDVGPLIGGLDRLGSLGTDQWSLATERSEIVTVASRAPVAESSSPSSPLQPTQPPVQPPAPPEEGGSEEENPVMGYSARAVLYHTAPDGQLNDQVRFRLLDENRADIAASNAFFDPAHISFESEYFENFQFNDDGTVTATLKDDSATQAAMAAASGNLYDYIKIVVSDGNEYIMQVVVSQDGTFNSAAEDLLKPPAQGSIDREWHSETNGTGAGNRYSSQGDDEVWLKGNPITGQDTLSTGAGSDAVTISGKFQALDQEKHATIDLGADNDTLTMGQSDWIYATLNGSVTLKGGSGDDTLDIKSPIYSYSGARVEVDGGADNDFIKTGNITVKNKGTSTVNGGDGNDQIYTGNITAESGLAGNTVAGGKVEITGGVGNDFIKTGTITAKEKGENTVDGGVGNDVIETGTITAKDKGENTVNGGDGKDEISIYNVYTDNSKAVIAGGNDDDAISVNGYVFAQAGGSSQVTGGEGADSITIHGIVQAVAGGSNRVDGGVGNDEIFVGSMYADNSKNVITGGEGVDSITIHGAVQTNTGGSNIIGQDISDSENADIIRVGNVIASGKSSSNTVQGKDVVVDSATPQALWAYNDSGGKAANTISSLGDLTIGIRADSSSENFTGVKAYASGSGSIATNSLNADGKVVIDSSRDGHTNAQGWGVQAHSHSPGSTAINTIYGKEGVEITSEGRWAKGVAADAGYHYNGTVGGTAENHITSGKHIAITSKNYNPDQNDKRNDAIDTLNGAKNILHAQEDITVRAEGEYLAVGIINQGKHDDPSIVSHTKLTSVNGSIHISAQSGDNESREAMAIHSNMNGLVEIDAKGDITLTATAGGSAGALDGQNVATYSNNTRVKGTFLHSEEGNITLSADGGRNADYRSDLLAASGLRRSANLVTDDGNIIINAKAGQGTANGILSSVGVTILEANGNLAEGKGKVEITSTAENHMADGINACNDAFVSVTAKQVDIAAKAGEFGIARGLNALLGGESHINAAHVTITADCQGEAYGMYAKSGSENHITNEGLGAITVIITATAGSLDKAYAMYASTDANNGAGSMNLIHGGSAVGGEGDSISLTGAIYADAGSENRIFTGEGDDFISLNGEVTGMLDMKANGGYDTLVLHATSADVFKANYLGWLNDLFNGEGEGFKGTSIENITVEFSGTSTDLGDVSWLINQVNNYNTSHSGHEVDLNFNFGAGSGHVELAAGLGFSGSMFDGGSGDDVLRITGNANELQGFFDSNSQDNSISGFETLILDMSNSSNDTVTLDDLLKGLGGSNAPDKIYINGDANLDTVDVGSAVKSGAYYDEASSRHYDIYTHNTSEETLQVYIQQGLLG